MLRAVLVGLLAVTAIGCKSEDETAKSQPGVAAGKVVELSGTVTLHRGSETKPLAKGDTVETDDIVETGAEGGVSIELAHNNATWQLGANKKVKVRESLAWNEAKKDKTATAVEQDSAAAGRHAERNAADTTVSAAAPAATEEASAAAEAMRARLDAESAQKQAPNRPAPPPPKATAAPKPAATAAPSPPPPRRAPASMPERAKTAAPRGEKLDDASDSFGEGGLGPSGTATGGGGTGDGIGLGGTGGKVGGSADAAIEARKEINLRLRELTKCFKDPVKVTFKIDAQGRVALAFSKPLEEREKQCADKFVHTFAFAKSATTVTIDVKP